MGLRKSFSKLSHVHADLGRDNYFFAVSVSLHPLADDQLRFSALVAGRPFGIRICSIDCVETGACERIQQLKRFGLVHSPAKNISSKNKRRNFHSCFTERSCFHYSSNLSRIPNCYRTSFLAFRARLRHNQRMEQTNPATRIVDVSRELGFDLCGIAPAAEFSELARLDAWLES